MGKVLERLVAARDLISDPTRWTKGTFARDKDGLATSPRSQNAVCWCSVGAVEKQNVFITGREIDALDSAAKILLRARTTDQGINIVYVNDVLGHEMAMKVFDLAIERAKEFGDWVPSK